MPHNVHPYAHRIGIIRDWRSRWFAGKGKYPDFLKCDVLLREFLDKKLRGFYVGGIDIERDQKALKINIKTGRPGMIIGKNGEGATKLKKEINTFLKKGKLIELEEVKIDIEEIRNPESNARIVSEMIAESLEKRMPFRRIMKQMIEKVMASREVEGVRIYIGGRLNGAEISRSETLKKGRIPLQTFRADIDFWRERAHMTYGDLGIKVWIYKGEIFDKDSK